MNETREKVQWSAEEKQDLVERVANTLMREPSRGMLTALRGHVKQMPRDRQREIATLTAVPWLETAVNTRISTTREALATAQQQLSAVQKELVDATEWNVAIQERNTELENENSRLRTEANCVVDPTTQILETLEYATIGQLLHCLHRRLTTEGADWFDRIVSTVKTLEQLADRVPEVTPTNHHGQVLRPVRKPRVLVCGPSTEQFEPLVKRFDKLQLTCPPAFAKNRGGDHKGLPTIVDKVFVLVKFTSHPRQHALQAKYGRDAVQLVPGGITDLSNAIQKWSES